MISPLIALCHLILRLRVIYEWFIFTIEEIAQLIIINTIVTMKLMNHCPSQNWYAPKNALQSFRFPKYKIRVDFKKKSEKHIRLLILSIIRWNRNKNRTFRMQLLVTTHFVIRSVKKNNLSIPWVIALFCFIVISFIKSACVTKFTSLFKRKTYYRDIVFVWVVARFVNEYKITNLTQSAEDRDYQWTLIDC